MAKEEQLQQRQQLQQLQQQDVFIALDVTTGFNLVDFLEILVRTTFVKSFKTYAPEDNAV